MAVEGGFAAYAWTPARAEGRGTLGVEVDGRHFRSSDTGLWANEAGPTTVRLVGPAEHVDWEAQEYCQAGSRDEDRQRREFGHSSHREAHSLHNTGAEVKRDLRGEQIPNRRRCIDVRRVGWNERRSGRGPSGLEEDH